MRVHLACRRMSLREADILEYYLKNVPGVTAVKVFDRTQDAIITYHADRTALIRALAAFSFASEQAVALVPEHTSRQLNREYEDKLVFTVCRRAFSRLFLPYPITTAIALFRSVKYIKEGLKALWHGKLSVAVLDATAVTVSMLRGDFNTAGSVMFMLRLGEILEEWTHKKSVADLAGAMALNVDKVWLQSGETELLVPIGDVRPGDRMIVRTGNLIALDGKVVEGEAMVNQSSMTGEPLAVQRSKGSSVFASTVVEEGRIVIRVSSVGDKTRIRQVVSFIEESEQLKASIQGKTERLADMAVPFTFALAGIVFLITRNLRRAASVLLVDYSCALKLATPLAVLSSMREGAAHGVVIKGGRYLEALNEADTLVFDKTGTLTNATPQVVDVIAAEGHDPREVLKVMACLEEHFPHPVARSVVRKAQQENIRHEEEHDEVEYIVAHGVASTLHGKKLRVGSRHYIENDEGIDVSPLEKEIVRQTSLGRSLLYLAEDGTIAGMLAIEDPLRPEAVEVIQELRGEGFKRILMLTGDDTRTAKAIAKRAGITEFRAQILPADKAQIVKELSDSGCRVLMVGDGINDAPALSASHVGVAMVDGTDLAQEVANVLLTRPDLHGIVTARRLSRATLNRIHRNFAITLIANSLFIAGGLFMILQPGLSALLHNLTTLGVSLYAMRPYLPASQNETADTAAAEAEA